VSCAQVSISGGGGKTPSDTVTIPGAFKASDPGYKANVRAQTAGLWIGLTGLQIYSGGSNNYVIPGPKPVSSIFGVPAHSSLTR
jgi:hypothetical protein